MYVVLIIPIILKILIKRNNIATKNGCSFISKDAWDQFNSAGGTET